MSLVGVFGLLQCFGYPLNSGIRTFTSAQVLFVILHAKKTCFPTVYLSCRCFGTQPRRICDQQFSDKSQNSVENAHRGDYLMNVAMPMHG